MGSSSTTTTTTTTTTAVATVCVADYNDTHIYWAIMKEVRQKMDKNMPLLSEAPAIN